MTTFAPALTALTLAASLQQDVDSILHPQEAAPAPREAFCIDTEDKADWYLRQLAACDAEIALLDSQHEAAVQRVRSDKDGLLHLYAEQLQAWAAHMVAQDKRGRKSIILPHGTVAFRTVPPRVTLSKTYQGEYPQEFMEAQPRLLCAPYLAHAEEVLAQTGEVLPGVEIVAGRESFSVKFGK